MWEVVWNRATSDGASGKNGTGVLVGACLMFGSGGRYQLSFLSRDHRPHRRKCICDPFSQACDTCEICRTSEPEVFFWFPVCIHLFRGSFGCFPLEAVWFRSLPASILSFYVG